MLPELVGRISTMLNYFLVQLVGPKCRDLKVCHVAHAPRHVSRLPAACRMRLAAWQVRDPEKYDFRPKKLLLEIATVYTHFARHAEFVTAIVKDDRSYNPSNINKAIRVLEKGPAPNMSPAGLQALAQFRERCEAAKQEEVDAEAELGEIPDEFLDPITLEIMADPVLLPSGKVMDRHNITRHLLSDETDPFSRARLTPDMLVPDDAMKEKIRVFRASRRSGAAEPMDLSQ